eukprot:COSAG01_NODE_1276_length_10938_cov_76.499862_11_plen_44_part_00
MAVGELSTSYGPRGTPPPPTLTTWRRTYLLPHDVETTICGQTI